MLSTRHLHHDFMSSIESGGFVDVVFLLYPKEWRGLAGM